MAGRLRGIGSRVGPGPGRCRPVSVQHAATLDVPLLVGGAEQLDGLFVDQSPEVLEGNVLTALNAHLLQNVTQTFFILHRLQTGNRKSAQIPAHTFQYKALPDTCRVP